MIRNLVVMIKNLKTNDSWEFSCFFSQLVHLISSFRRRWKQRNLNIRNY